MVQWNSSFVSQDSTASHRVRPAAWRSKTEFDSTLDLNFSKGDKISNEVNVSIPSSLSLSTANPAIIYFTGTALSGKNEEKKHEKKKCQVFKPVQITIMIS